uniref:Uncharacterized protein n=1 Tax=Neovison vison TaxID=452646 RepID=A0A8C7BX26_NEOVI
VSGSHPPLLLRMGSELTVPVTITRECLCLHHLAHPTTCQGPRWSPFLLASGPLELRSRGWGQPGKAPEPPVCRLAGRLPLPGQTRLSNVAVAPAFLLLCSTFSL